MIKCVYAMVTMLCACLAGSIILTGCGDKSKGDASRLNEGDVNSTTQDSISDDLLSSGGNFRKIVVIKSAVETSPSDQTESIDSTESTNQIDNDNTIKMNPALRSNIGLATMSLDELVGNLRISEDLSSISKESELELADYIQYELKYTGNYTVNDFDKSIRYFCWSLPDDVSNTFVNALGEICKEQGYLFDGFKVSKRTYHTKDYEHYIYEITDANHKIKLAINHNDSETIYYMAEDK